MAWDKYNEALETSGVKGYGSNRTRLDTIIAARNDLPQ
jgi:hypothetical protein